MQIRYYLDCFPAFPMTRDDPMSAIPAIPVALCLHLSATDPTRLFTFCCKQTSNRNSTER
jgi:hypothetical protein